MDIFMQLRTAYLQDGIPVSLPASETMHVLRDNDPTITNYSITSHVLNNIMNY